MARTGVLREWSKGSVGEGIEITSEPSKAPPEGITRYRQTRSGRPKTIAAIPCFNEEAFIGEIVRQASRHVDQVIVVNDGSRDGTAKVAAAAGATVISHEANRGYGAAIESCFKAARTNGTNIMVTLDGDNQHTPEEIDAVIAPIAKGEADLVIGSRFLQPSQHVNAPLSRKLGINAITWLFNFGSRAKVSDAQSGFRAYGREVIDAIRVTKTGMAASIEVLAKAREDGFVICEVPISCRYDSQSSTQNPLSHGVGVAFAVIEFRLRSVWPRRGASDGSSKGERGWITREGQGPRC